MASVVIHFLPERGETQSRVRVDSDAVRGASRRVLAPSAFLIAFPAIPTESKTLGLFLVLQIGQKPLVAEVQWPGVLPILMDDAVQTVNYFIVVNFNGQLAPAVEAARSQIDRSHNRLESVGQEHLGVQFKMPELVNFDSHIIHDAQSAHALEQLLLLQLVRRSCHHMDFHSPAIGADQALDNEGS